MQSSRSILVTVLSIGIGVTIGAFGILIVAHLIGPLPLSITQTTTAKQSTFDVVGESKITTIPDKALMNLGVTVNESTVKLTQDKANTIMNDIANSLSKLGVEKKDIKTDSYYLNPNYDYQQGRRITGYTINATLTISLTDFSTLNQVIDAATAAGANQIHGITFTLTDEKKKSVEDQARKEAIENAKEKATTLARLSGMRLGKIVNVMEQGNRFPEPFQMMRGLNTASDPQAVPQIPTETQPGSTTLQYTVTLSFETL